MAKAKIHFGPFADIEEINRRDGDEIVALYRSGHSALEVAAIIPRRTGRQFSSSTALKILRARGEAIRPARGKKGDKPDSFKYARERHRR